MKSIIYARISDNVLDPEDWPVRRLVVEGELVVDHSELPMRGLPLSSFGSHGPQVGWTLDQLLAWASVDNTGQHPEVSHDLRAEGDAHFAYYVSARADLDALLMRGRRWCRSASPQATPVTK